MKESLEAEIWTIMKTEQGNTVLLRPLQDDRVVPIYIGHLESQSILIGLGEVSVTRPLTHDLLINLLKKTGYKLEKVVISDMKNNTFLAELHISGGNYPRDKPLILDVRPSDAMGLAVRQKCPIFVNAAVLEETGIDGETVLMENEISSRRRIIRQELQEAVAGEEYERAAELRDLLVFLDEGHADGN
ncbi:MAG: bifunctional nuclease family protein [Treponema sp.]|jgi:bifunctional DNase/RNase|nr:bifunctional nuclease family protein [Treponema sp.]